MQIPSRYQSWTWRKRTVYGSGDRGVEEPGHAQQVRHGGGPQAHQRPERGDRGRKSGWSQHRLVHRLLRRG